MLFMSDFFVWFSFISCYMYCYTDGLPMFIENMRAYLKNALLICIAVGPGWK